MRLHLREITVNNDNTVLITVQICKKKEAKGENTRENMQTQPHKSCSKGCQALEQQESEFRYSYLAPLETLLATTSSILAARTALMLHGTQLAKQWTPITMGTKT